MREGGGGLGNGCDEFMVPKFVAAAAAAAAASAFLLDIGLVKYQTE